jgi:hypothetical protein
MRGRNVGAAVSWPNWTTKSLPWKVLTSTTGAAVRRSCFFFDPD